MPKKLPKYDFSKIEQKWQKNWEKKGVYEPDIKKAKKPFYNLMMFPYPSAEGLHVGNMYAFVGTDIFGRFQRMKGNDVFEPIGLDGFGIHSENYAMKVGTHPAKQAKVSEKRFYKQLQMVGNGFAWNERLETYDPEYYKWTQWLFIQLFKNGLAYRKKQAVNWCPSCKTVLADEQVISGKCERCSSEVEKKELEQWFFKITEYAEKLLKNLDKLDWSEKVKIAQRNWIGRSEGAELNFQISGSKKSIKVFTTRPDTLFGATYLVLAPEHPLIEELADSIQNIKDVRKYAVSAKAKSDEDRVEAKKKTGVELRGIKAVNPANQEEIPVWISDYVLTGYGTGAIMAVPAHDQRDFEFAKQFGLEIRTVINPVLDEPEEGFKVKNKIVALVEDGDKVLTINWGKNGGRLLIGGTVEDGEDPIPTAVREIQEETGYADVEFVEMGDEVVKHGYYSDVRKQAFCAFTKVLRFKLNSQRMGERNMDEAEMYKFQPEWVSRDQALKEITEPLHSYVLKKFVAGECYGGKGTLINSGEFSDMSSEEAKAKITKFAGGKKKIQYRLRDWLISRQRYWGPPIPMIYCEKCDWQPVPEKDLPVVLPMVKDFRPKGTGQSPLALSKKFYETKCPKCKGKARRETDVSDTFLDSAWYYLRYPNVKENKKPFDKKVIDKWFPVNMYIGGAEHSVLHLLYVRFMAMFLKDAGHINFEEPFSKFRAHGLLIKEGAKMSKSKGNVVNPDEYIKKFGADTLRMYLMFLAPFEQGGDFRDAGIMGVSRFLERVWKYAHTVTFLDRNFKETDIEKKLHRTIKKVSEDIENLRYNTAISALMIFMNELEQHERVEKRVFEKFLMMIAPFSPHITDELWEKLGNKKSIHLAEWPTFDPKMIKEESFTLVIQVNGKVKDTVELPMDISEEEVKEIVLKRDKIVALLQNKAPRAIIYIRNRLINLVI